MVSGNKVRIFKEFNAFKLYDSFATCETGKVKAVYNSLGMKGWLQRIEFYDNDLNQPIKLDLYGLKENTKAFSFNEKELGAQFISLCSLFKVDFKEQLKKHAFLCVQNEERLATLAIKKSVDNMVYVTVFMIDSGDSRKDATLYIHGIWKTSTIEVFNKKLAQLA